MIEDKPRRGRPPGSGKLTEAVIEAICKGVEEGKTQAQAAREAGIPTRTFYRWREKGKEAQRGIYQLFWRRLEEAHEQVKSRLVQTANRIAFPHEVTTRKQVIHPKTGEIVTLEEKKIVVDTGMLKFLLERQYPEEFGRKDKLDLGNADSDPFKLSIFGAVMGQGTGDEGR